MPYEGRRGIQYTVHYSSVAAPVAPRVLYSSFDVAVEKRVYIYDYVRIPRPCGIRSTCQKRSRVRLVLGSSGHNNMLLIPVNQG